MVAMSSTRSVRNSFLDFANSMTPSAQNVGTGDGQSRAESEVKPLSNVQRLVNAYNDMLKDRFSSSSNLISCSHIFYDSNQMPRRTNRTRTRAYRQSPNDRRWLTWDSAQDSQRWLSDSNLANLTNYNNNIDSLDKRKTGSTYDEIGNLAPDEGCHCDVSPSSVWSGVNNLSVLPAGRHSTTSSLGSSALSEDDFLLSRSSSCTMLSGRESRSVSTDSAVEVDLIPLHVNHTSSRQSPSRSISCDQWEKKPPKKTGRSDSCDIPANPPIQPPSVVISDHSGDKVSFTVLTNDFCQSRLRRPVSFVTEPLNDLGLSVSKVCPRKVSDCSTCSSVSTVDMSSDSHLALDELLQSRKMSCCSNCSTYTSHDIIEEEFNSSTIPDAVHEDIGGEKEPADYGSSDKTSNWRKVKNVVQWTPFIQTYMKKKYPWVQLAGHQGNFKAGEKQGTILKKLCPAEKRALEALMKDDLKPYVPEYMGLVDSSDEQYLQLQDLLSDFNAPCVMDIKMGVRTYLEDELAKAREKPKLRKDMYEKMIQIDPNAPSDAEHRAQAVTKPRYMVWRETISSTATLGFRIEGVKKSDGSSSKDFKTTRTQEQVLKSLSSFMEGYSHAPTMYLKRLKEIRATLESSNFFISHELIGSSLLFVHNEDSAVVWLIDFAKSIPLPEDVKVTHRAPWVEGTHEDGYLLGLDNLISLISHLEEQSLSKQQSSTILGEGSKSTKCSPPEASEQDKNGVISNSVAETVDVDDSSSPSLASASANASKEGKPSPSKTTTKTLSKHYLIPTSPPPDSNQKTEDCDNSSKLANSEPSNSSSNDIRNMVKNSTETNSIS